MTANAAWVSVGITSDTAQFAVASIRRWLDEMGRERYPDARELTITADGGGSRSNACGCGRSSCRSSPMRRASCSASITTAGHVQMEGQWAARGIERVVPGRRQN